jgi:hypothetical protein
MYYFIAACALWVGFTTMLALFFVLYGSSFPQDEAAADLMKNLDVKPVYFLVYNLTFFLMSLGFVLTYRSACGSEMYLREQEQTCYGVRSAGFIVVALMGVVMLYARKIVLVGFTMPKMKVKASKVTDERWLLRTTVSLESPACPASFSSSLCLPVSNSLTLLLSVSLLEFEGEDVPHQRVGDPGERRE